MKNTWNILKTKRASSLFLASAASNSWPWDRRRNFQVSYQLRTRWVQLGLSESLQIDCSFWFFWFCFWFCALRFMLRWFAMSHERNESNRKRSTHTTDLVYVSWPRKLPPLGLRLPPLSYALQKHVTGKGHHGLKFMFVMQALGLSRLSAVVPKYSTDFNIFRLHICKLKC